jgi:hypothetical protein
VTTSARIFAEHGGLFQVPVANRIPIRHPEMSLEIADRSGPSPAKLPQSNFLREFEGLRKPRNSLNTS